MRDLVSFAAIKSFYDAEHDLLDVVCGFVLYHINETTYNSERLHVKINNEFKLNIPLDIIRSALKRLRNKYKLIDCTEGYSKVVLTENGLKEQRKNHEIVETTREQYNELLIDIKKFIENKNGMKISLQETRDYLKSAISNNPSDIFLFALPGNPDTPNKNRALSIIAEYILEQEKIKSDKFEILQAIIYANILCSALEAGEITQNSNLKKLDIYLDSNIVFGILGLDDDVHNNLASEMLQVLLSFNLNVKIFIFTLDEIRNKLLSYSGKYHAYIPDIEVDSIYFRIKAQNLQETDILLFVNDVEKKLNDQKIFVDYSSSDIDLNNFDKELAPKLTSKKEERYRFSDREGLPTKQNYKHPATIEHDLLAIRAIKEIRKRMFNKIEESQAIFLTADAILAKFNYEEYGHRDSRTIPEVFFRTQLVSFLWFKNPKTSAMLPIRDLMSGYIRTRIVSEKLWDIFIWELKKQVEQNIYSKEDIATLISLKETKSVLLEIQEGGHDYTEDIKKKIIDSGLINEAKKIREESEKLKKYKKETEDVLEEKSEQIEESHKIIFGAIKSIENSCARMCKNTVNVSIYVTLVVIIFILFVFVPWNNFTLSKVVDVLSLVSLIFFITILIISIVRKEPLSTIPYLVEKRKILENRMVQNCIKKRRQKLGL